MKYLVLFALLLVACQPEIIYLDKLEHPGYIEIRNEIFEGRLDFVTAGHIDFRDTVYTDKDFNLNESIVLSVDEGAYSVLIDAHKSGAYHYSSMCVVYRDSLTVKICY